VTGLKGESFGMMSALSTKDLHQILLAEAELADLQIHISFCFIHQPAESSVAQSRMRSRF